MVLPMSQLRDTPLSGLGAKEHGVISSAAAESQGRTASMRACFSQLGSGLWQNQLGWGLLGFRKTVFEAQWAGGE